MGDRSGDICESDERLRLLVKKFASDKPALSGEDQARLEMLNKSMDLKYPRFSAKDWELVREGRGAIEGVARHISAEGCVSGGNSKHALAAGNAFRLEISPEINLEIEIIGKLTLRFPLSLGTLSTLQSKPFRELDKIHKRIGQQSLPRDLRTLL